ncbi:MAG: ribonuclease HII, partial [Candidatus Pacearchaeota archaeon]
LVNEDIEKEFMKIGVKDSKKLFPRRREKLAEEIKKLAIKWEFIKIPVNEIDGKDNENLNLNQREAIAASMIINKINSDLKGKEKIKVIIDCPSTNIDSWKRYLETFIIAKSNVHLVCEHKADENHIAVSAASIIAKTIREEEIKKIKKEIGIDFGSGYSSDPITRKFIRENYQKFKDKEIFRESWATIRSQKSKNIQKKLFQD